jgi:hypothetical protein
MTYPHMQTILSAIANLQANPLPSSRAVAEDASTAHQLKQLCPTAARLCKGPVPERTVLEGRVGLRSILD